ncbi:MAG: AAA family ATPase [Clostridia bacterium]
MKKPRELMPAEEFAMASDRLEHSPVAYLHEPKTQEELEAELEKIKADGVWEDGRPARLKRLAALPVRGYTVQELLDMEFPPPVWVIPDLLTTGLTILAGAPKLGKSWLALAIATAVGSGGAVLGTYRVQARDALYLALEDTPRRLKARLEKLGAARISNVTICGGWRSGAEGLADLDVWLEENRDTRLVIIDTLARFRGGWRPGGTTESYAEDYAVAGQIKAVADRHDTAIVAVHHVRKAASEDPMETVSGTNGLNGGADCTWVLTRSRGEADAKLYATGRDIEEQNLALSFDREFATWRVLGDAAEYTQGQERRAVLDVLPMGAAMKTSDIATAIGKKEQATGYLLSKLEAEGLVKKPKYGYWTRLTSPVTTVTPVSNQQELQDSQDLQGGITPVEAAAVEQPDYQLF